MLERTLHSYTFSDVSAAFFAGAMQKLAAFPEVEFKVFDLEKAGTEQGFELGAFDLILGANVLHAVSEVRVALQHLHELLVPGGSLLFIDTATPQLWTETLFGLTSGWWRFQDRDLRPSQPLLERSQWETILREAGFEETASLPGLIAPEGGEGQIGVLARKAPAHATEESIAVETVQEGLKETSWLIFADRSGLGMRLASRLRKSGARCRVAHRGFDYAAGEADTFTLRADALEDWKQLLEATADDFPERLVYCWTLDERLEDDPVLLGTSVLLHLAQAIELTRPAAKLRIDLVTRGAQPVGEATMATAVEQAPAIGLMRVILIEQSHLTCRGIDLPPLAFASDENLVWEELLQNDSEREIAFRGEALRETSCSWPPPP
jgi:hypothetical protein